METSEYTSDSIRQRVAMKKIVCVALVLVAVVTVFAMPAQAWHHGFRSHVFIGVGPGWWGPPYWYYPPPAYAYAPPVVVQESPPVYIQQSPPPPPPPPAAQAVPDSFWYYCSSARGYYPSVPQCPEAWVKVPAQ
jgi:hypothetical protein